MTRCLDRSRLERATFALLVSWIAAVPACGSDPDPAGGTGGTSGTSESASTGATADSGGDDPSSDGGGSGADESSSSGTGPSAEECAQTPLSGFGPLTVREAQTFAEPLQGMRADVLVLLPDDRFLGRGSQRSSIPDAPDTAGWLSLSLPGGLDGWKHTFGCGVHAAALSADGTTVLVGGSLAFDCSEDGEEFTAEGTRSTNIFLATYDSRTGSRLSRNPYAVSLSTTGTALPNGNVVLAGRSEGSEDFGAGPVGPPGGGFALYLAEYDATATPIAVHQVPGNLQPRAMTSDEEGNIYVAGASPSGAYDLGQGSTNDRIWIVSLDPSGAIRWSLTAKGSSSSWVDEIAVSTAGVAAVIEYANGDLAHETPVDFGAGPLEGSGKVLLSLDRETGALRAQRVFPTFLLNGVAISDLGDIAMIVTSWESIDLGGGVLPMQAPTPILANYTIDTDHITSRAFTTGCGDDSSAEGVVATVDDEFVTAFALSEAITLPDGTDLAEGRLLFRWAAR